MDAMTPLAGQLVTILGPFLPTLVAAGKDLAGRAVTELQAEGLELAQEIWGQLGPQIEQREATREAAQDAAAQPDDEDVRGALRVQLRKLLADDAALADALRRTIEESQAQQPGANTVTASGAGSVAIGRDASGATIVTGNQNRLQK